MVVGGFEGQAHRRREAGLARAGNAGKKALGAQAERCAKGELALQLAGLVGVPGDHQSPGPQKPDLDARGPLQVGREIGPKSGGAQPEVEQLATGGPELGLGDGREHAGGDPRGRQADPVALQDRHRQACRARAAGDRQADDAATNDEHV